MFEYSCVTKLDKVVKGQSKRLIVLANAHQKVKHELIQGRFENVALEFKLKSKIQEMLGPVNPQRGENRRLRKSIVVADWIHPIFHSKWE